MKETKIVVQLKHILNNFANQTKVTTDVYV